MDSLVCIFALSVLYVTFVSSHIVSNVFEGIRLNDTNICIAKTIVVDQSGHGNFKTIQSAIDSVAFGNNCWTKIYVKRGIYNEKVTIQTNKTRIQMVGDNLSNTIIQYNDGGHSVKSATFTVSAEFFVAISITFKNTYNQEKPITPWAEIKVAPAILLAADKAAFFGCEFVGMQDTVGDLHGRHYFQQCSIKGAIDFIWGKGQSIYQSCRIEVLRVTSANGGLLVGFITAQGRETEQETGGFVFIGCAIVGASKAFLGRAYRGYSRVIFSRTNMADMVVPQGWDAWTYQGHENKLFYVEENCDGPGANKKGRVAWEKNLSAKDLSYFTNTKSFLSTDGWLETIPPHSFNALSPSYNSYETSFG